jgi:hypothetical protein
VDLEAQAETLKAEEAALVKDEAEIAEGLVTLKARKAQMKQEKEAYLAQRLDQALSGQGVPKAESERRQALSGAQQAFERIVSAAGAPPARSIRSRRSTPCRNAPRWPRGWRP